jgi:hypothetical protein
VVVPCCCCWSGAAKKHAKKKQKKLSLSWEQTNPEETLKEKKCLIHDTTLDSSYKQESPETKIGFNSSSKRIKPVIQNVLLNMGVG